MPELPEVETIRSGLSRLLIGRQITKVEHNWGKSFPNSPEDVASFLIGSHVIGVTRRAKVLIIALDSVYSLVIHLKVTGQLVFRGEQNFGAGHPSNSLVGKLPDKSTHVSFEFSDSSKLYFNDQRKFGWVRLLPTSEVPNIDFMKKLGPEPLAYDFTPAQFTSCLRRRFKSNIKSVLLDQTIVAGVGNIYADESLWGARIHPKSLVKDLSDQKIKKLFKELQFVLNLSIEKGGSTDRNYIDAEGKRGSYLTFARVFRREGKLCPRCSHEIIKIRVAARGTHICPHCQREEGS
jgi:formamidopyrimidine-DNA glycosylase